MKFYLGSHMPHWLSKPDVPPLFISHRRLMGRKRLPVATGRWSLDSGGFTELSMFGRWTTTPMEYVDAVRRYQTEIGGMDWAAPQDWMCEPWIIANTGRTVGYHQSATVDNFCQLHQRAPDIPFIPVLQGQTLADYHRHLEMYQYAGVDLWAYDTVGLGSVCRRQNTDEIAELVADLSGIGLRLHGFGVKGEGLRRYGWALRSADSMSWSARGRRINPCPHTAVKSCANCYPHALEWRRRALTGDARSVQLALVL